MNFSSLEHCLLLEWRHYIAQHLLGILENSHFEFSSPDRPDFQGWNQIGRIWRHGLMQVEVNYIPCTGEGSFQITGTTMPPAAASNIALRLIHPRLSIRFASGVTDGEGKWSFCLPRAHPKILRFDFHEAREVQSLTQLCQVSL